MKKLELICFGGVGAVTGANFMLRGEFGKILIDCGLRQGDRFAEGENYEEFPYDPKDVSVLLVTHAHMDHIGRIPKLVKDGFRGIIMSTKETKMLSEIMYSDAISLLRTEASEHHREPLYEEKDAQLALSLWQTLDYHEKRELRDGVNILLKDAGHILGSSMIEVSYGSKKMLFTGDLGNSPSILLPDTESPEGIDYLLIESVYGDRNHESHEERDEKFAKIIAETIKRGGTTVIPSFSLERTQNILYSLNNLIEDGRIPSVPVFVDSPLAIKVTEIYRNLQNNFKSAIKKEIKEGDDIFNFPKLKYTTSKEESDDIKKINGAKIILAGSGMSAGGRVTKHEKEYLPDSRNTIMLVGFQTLGTLGRKIQEGAKFVEIEGRKIMVKANVENIRAFSSHKDSDHLLEFVSKCQETVKKIFVVMGEPKSSLFLAQKIRDNLSLDAIYPEKGKVYILDFE